MEKYDYYNRRAKNVLIHECGWSLENETGSWRSIRPEVDPERCDCCSMCWLFCPDGAISRVDGKIFIDLKYCKGCGICAAECPKQALKLVREGEAE